MRPVPEIGLYIIMSKMDNKMILCAIGGVRTQYNQIVLA